MLKQPKLEQLLLTSKGSPSKRIHNRLNINTTSILAPLYPSTIKSSPIQSVSAKRKLRTMSTSQAFFKSTSPEKRSSDDADRKSSFVDSDLKGTGNQIGEQGKGIQLECVSAVSNGYRFKDFMNKIEMDEKRKKHSPTKLVIKQDNTLKTALKDTYDIPKLNGNITKLNLAKLDTNISDSSPSQSPESYRIDNGFRHSPYSKQFVFDETVLQKVKSRGSPHKKVKETLKEEDKEIFEMFERCKHNIMNHGEWFTDSKVQMALCSTIAEIEHKWIGPCIASQLKLISCEKEQLEKELKEQQDLQ